MGPEMPTSYKAKEPILGWWNSTALNTPPTMARRDSPRGTESTLGLVTRPTSVQVSTTVGDWMSWTTQQWGKLTLRSSKVHSPNRPKEKCIVRYRELVVLSSFTWLKPWKAKFFILCVVIFLARLQEKFEIDLNCWWRYLLDRDPN